MALFAAPIVGGVVGGAYLWAAYKLTVAVDTTTRRTLLLADEAVLPETGEAHALLFAAGWAVSYAAAAQALKPAFSRLHVPNRVESVVQLAQSLAPGLARHTVACTAAVAAAAAGTAAFDVRLAREQQRPRGSGGSGPAR